MSEFADEVIRRWYAVYGTKKCKALLPGWTDIKIRRRAAALGIKRVEGYKRGPRSDVLPFSELPEQPWASLHRQWQKIDRAIPVVNNGPLIARIAA